MPDPIVIPGEYLYFILIPLIPSIISAVIIFLKRSETSGKTAVVTDLNITSISRDLTEVKVDIKEQRKEIQTLSDNIRDMNVMKDRMKNLEDSLQQNIRANNPRFEDALRQIDVLNVRVANLEENMKRNTSNIANMKRGDINEQ